MAEKRFLKQGDKLKWGLCAAFAAGVVVLWADYGSGSADLAFAVKPKPAPLALTPAPRLLEAASLNAYRAAFERPLFHPSRRAFAERAVAQVVAPPPMVIEVAPPQGFLLRGAVISGPFRLAIFERTGQNSYIRLREGEELQGWQIARVDRKQVVLRMGSKEVTWPLVK